MPWSDGITGVHRDIAGDPGAPVHVLAGPGTGKTLAMMRRVARLLEAGVDPRGILAVTFTRTASRDLKEQLLQLNSPGANQVHASTLHSLCFQALAVQAVFQATGRNARPLMAFEIEQLKNDLKSSFGGKRAVQAFIEAYDAAWARLQHEVAGAPRDPQDQEFENALLDWLRYHRAILIGELVPITLRHLQQNPLAGVLPTYGSVLVDEYQDLNKADQSLIEVLSQAGQLTVIGDDNQSIYSFRHANPEGIRVFPAQHAGTHEYLIDECWRCPPNIVQMSNALIARDPTSRNAPLQPRQGEPNADVYIVQHRTMEEEADTIAAFIDHYLTNHPDLPPGQALVLSPRRTFGNMVRDALIRRHRNALSYFWEDALEKAAAAEGFCLLSLLVDPTDRAAFRAWLGMGHPDGYAGAYKRIRAFAEANALEPRAICDQVTAGTVQIAHSTGIAARNATLAARLGALAGLNGMALVDALWPDGTPDTLSLRIAAQTLAQTAPTPPDLLDGLREVITQPELPDSAGDIIRVMSLHKSKGLTAALVAVVGCIGGAIPSVDRGLPAAEQDLIEKEQRRLFYVAITRAKRVLVLSSITTLPLRLALASMIQPTRITHVGTERIAHLAASPFLAELGPAAPVPTSGGDWRESLNF